MNSNDPVVYLRCLVSSIYLRIPSDPPPSGDSYIEASEAHLNLP